ncbi:MAG: rhomboid family intramembrane serine protease, partial [Candidatus Odinarchaeota archaeon]
KNKYNIILGIVSWSSILVSLFLIADFYPDFRSFMSVSSSSFTISSFTSLFMHNDLNHLVNNLLFFLPTSMLAFSVFGVKKGSLLLILSGYVAKQAEFLLVFIMNVFLLLFEQCIRSEIIVFGDLIIPIKGAGLSGALMGWVGVLMLYWFRAFRWSDLGKMIDTREKASLKVLYYSTGGLLMLVVIIMVIVDLNNFIAFYGPYLLPCIVKNWEINLSTMEGNQFLGHLLGFLSGLIISIFWNHGASPPSV